MGSVVDCFFLEPHPEAIESFRRFVFSTKAQCSSGHGYHNAEITIGQGPWTEKFNGRGADDFDHGDPRWPATCACGYVFQAEDEWQHNFSQLWVRKDTGQTMQLDEAPAGAMWYAPWLEGIPDFQNTPDGRVLIVRTPGGEWNIDSKSTNGGGWTRSGTPPKVTANPSILTGKKADGNWIYHGWLRDGQLVEC